MTDDKRSAKHKILGELESIKTLLDNDRGSEEPPLLTTPAETSDVPVLTEALNGFVRNIEGKDGAAAPESTDLNDDDIPVLQATVEESEWGYAEDEGKDLARALKSRDQLGSAPSLFGDPDDSPAAEPLTAITASEEMAREIPPEVEAESAELSAETATGSRPSAALPAEEQPGLFDQEPSEDKTAAPRKAASDAAEPDETAPGQTSERSNRPIKAGAANGPLTPPKSENPFLPKHIRDRLHANRAAQREMLDSFSKPPSQSSENSRGAETPSADEQLVDEMLQLYLPQIEAELRKKIRALIKEERDANQEQQEPL